MGYEAVIALGGGEMKPTCLRDGRRLGDIQYRGMYTQRTNTKHTLLKLNTHTLGHPMHFLIYKAPFNHFHSLYIHKVRPNGYNSRLGNSSGNELRPRKKKKNEG